jgi:hypothetical protein
MWNRNTKLSYSRDAGNRVCTVRFAFGDWGPLPQETISNMPLKIVWERISSVHLDIRRELAWFC